MSKRKKYQKRHYNAEMIQDFFDHLRWEYAINHFENTHHNAVNPELVEQLKKYSCKYNIVGLMDSLVLDLKNLSEEQEKKAIESFRNVRIDEAKKVLEALDTLKPYLEKALYHIHHPKDYTINEITIDPQSEG